MYTKQSLKNILNQVRAGKLSCCEALRKLECLPTIDMGFARIDTHRTIRRGFPEAVFCQGKTCEQIEKIAGRLAASRTPVILTRATRQVYDVVSGKYPGFEYNEAARIVFKRGKSRRGKMPRGKVLVVSAGTSDIPVAEEAALTSELMGCRVKRLYDVGVAGIHRLLVNQHELRSAGVIIAVAGMEGALASVVSGLVEKPLIAVPTSVGYGASFSGLAALLAMLNCCSPGVAVVNIDNGFGAGYFASQIVK